MATQQYDVKSQHMSLSGVAVPFRTRLKAFLISADTGAAGEIGFYDSYYRTGTYARLAASTTVTITFADHGLYAGQWVYLDFTSGTGLDALYQINAVTTNTFTVTTAASTATSGNVNFYGEVLSVVDVKGAGQTFVLVPGEGVLSRTGMIVILPANVKTTLYYG